MRFLEEEDLELFLTQQLNKMKLAGFIKEHNCIKEAVGLNELITNPSESYPNIEKVIKYLNSGALILAWMGYFIDEKKKILIAPDSYYTDGVWVWPAYLPYYLGVYPFLKLDPNFLSHIENQKFELKVDEKFENQKNVLEKELSEKLSTSF